MNSNLAGESSSTVTEERNPQTMDLDVLETLELVERIQQQDFVVADAVKKCVPEITRAVDEIARRLASGGRLFYFGAGTSGDPLAPICARRASRHRTAPGACA